MLGAVALTVIILGTGALVVGKLGSRFIDWVDSREVMADVQSSKQML